MAAKVGIVPILYNILKVNVLVHIDTKDVLFYFIPFKLYVPAANLLTLPLGETSSAVVLSGTVMSQARLLPDLQIFTSILP